MKRVWLLVMYLLFIASVGAVSAGNEVCGGGMCYAQRSLDRSLACTTTPTCTTYDLRCYEDTTKDCDDPYCTTPKSSCRNVCVSTIYAGVCTTMQTHLLADCNTGPGQCSTSVRNCSITGGVCSETNTAFSCCGASNATPPSITVTPPPTPDDDPPPPGVPTCSVTVNGQTALTQNVNEGQAVTAVAQGIANDSTARTMRLWVERRDRAAIAGLSGGVTSGGVNYYQIATCSTSTSSCTATSASLTLPKGDYFFHCDIDTGAGNRCSGNPFCDYEFNVMPASIRPSGTAATCSTWNSCSTTDWKYASVVVPQTQVTVNVYDAPDLNCNNTTSLSGSGYLGGVARLEETTPASVVAREYTTTTRSLVASGYTTTFPNVHGRSSSVTDPNARTYALTYTSDNLDPDYSLVPGCTYSRSLVVKESPLTANFVVNKRALPWWQAVGGDVRAAGNVNVTVPSLANLGSYPYAMNNLSGQAQSSGVFVVGGTTTITGNAAPTNRYWRANANIYNPVTREDYSYFFGNFELSSPTVSISDAVITSLPPTTSATKAYPDGSVAYYHEGNLTINAGFPALADGTKRTVFVNAGNLIINTNITVNSGSYLAFVVDGNITVASNVTAVQGVYVADGNLTIQGTNVASPFVGSGIFTAWGSVSLGRTLYSATDAFINNKFAAEQFVYRPDFLVNAPYGFLKSSIEWKEVAP